MELKTREDYLRVMYEIYEKQDSEERDSGIKSVDVATFLNVSRASVSEINRKLKTNGLVESKKYTKVQLTEKGLREAKKAVYRHRVIEVFLVKILKYNAEDINMEAETHRLEHAFSEESVKRLDNLLQNPKLCPHGKKIHK
ncbi:MAG: metal-dependent transcriptional regulator [Candidatus Aenigmarchaeota archaeon]|nr:metal-dependent transcriptional regulator [Candidatus Aenigmarchaeota archaeon]